MHESVRRDQSERVEPQVISLVSEEITPETHQGDGLKNTGFSLGDRGRVIAIEEAGYPLDLNERKHLEFAKQLQQLLDNRNRLTSSKSANEKFLFPDEKDYKFDSPLEKANELIQAHIEHQYPAFSKITSNEMKDKVIGILSSENLLCAEKAHRLLEVSKETLEKHNVTDDEGEFKPKYSDAVSTAFSGILFGAIGGGLINLGYTAISAIVNSPPSSWSLLVIVGTTTVLTSMAAYAIELSDQSDLYNSDDVQSAMALSEVVKQMQERHRQPIPIEG